MALPSDWGQYQAWLAANPDSPAPSYSIWKAQFGSTSNAQPPVFAPSASIIPGIPNWALFGGVGVAAYLLLKRK